MKKIISILVAFAPSLALAQTQTITDANSLTYKLLDIGNTVIYILIALAVIFIVYNVVMFIIKGNDSAKKQEAGGNIGWGFLGLFIILSIWGIVNVLTNTFRTTPTTQSIPNVSQNVNSGGLPGSVVPIVR